MFTPAQPKHHNEPKRHEEDDENRGVFSRSSSRGGRTAIQPPRPPSTSFFSLVIAPERPHVNGDSHKHDRLYLDLHDGADDVVVIIYVQPLAQVLGDYIYIQWLYIPGPP